MMILAVWAALMSLGWAIRNRPTRSELLYRALYERTAAPVRAAVHDPIDPPERREA